MTEPANYPVCPRCLGFIPSNERPGEYEGALSRLTRTEDRTKRVYVCSACGSDEGMQEAFGDGATPMDQWPIVTETTPVQFAVHPSTLDGKNRVAGLTT